MTRTQQTTGPTHVRRDPPRPAHATSDAYPAPFSKERWAEIRSTLQELCSDERLRTALTGAKGPFKLAHWEWEGDTRYNYKQTFWQSRNDNEVTYRVKRELLLYPTGLNEYTAEWKAHVKFGSVRSGSPEVRQEPVSLNFIHAPFSLGLSKRRWGDIDPRVLKAEVESWLNGPTGQACYAKGLEVLGRPSSKSTFDAED